MDRLSCAAILLAGLLGCSATPSKQSGRTVTDASGGGPTTGSGGSGNVDTKLPPDLSIGGSSDKPDDTQCAAATQKATAETKPIDIIFVIDNSGSMSEEIAEVGERINTDFAKIVGDAGVDYRVIMISLSHPLVKEMEGGVMRPGGGGLINFAVCVKSPLGATDCSKPDDIASLEKPPTFFHYSTMVNSTDAWCILMDAWTKPDELGRSKGWSEYLRPNAFKNFVTISDDTIRCVTADRAHSFPKDGGIRDIDDILKGGSPESAEASARDFDTAFLALSAEHFGTTEKRNYRFHSIVGLVANSPAESPWLATSPLQSDNCGPEAVNSGPPHQALSIMTGGLRYPLCQHENFDAIFRAIAENIVTESRLSCEWRIPDPPSSQTLDYAKVNLQYRSEAKPDPTLVPKVSDAGACDESGGWYYDRAEKPEKIVVCPTTCQLLQAAKDAQVDIAFGCDTKVRVK